jgi:hypothetical protein
LQWNLKIMNMTTHNYKYMLSSAPARYHRAHRGGNKVLREYLERNRYDNCSLLACEKKVVRPNNNKQNKIIMATKNLLTSTLGENVLRGVRSRMFNDFCESLCASLVSSASASCGVGRITYAALIATWRKDTANCAYMLNESEGRKLYNADNNDSRLRRIGCEGHWSHFVSPSAKGGNKDDNKESDSISVLVGSWLRSWSSWYDSVVQYGHYGENGLPSASSVSVGLLTRCRDLWSTRGVGGRVAASSEEKAQKKVAKAVAGLSSAELLAALRASGVDLAALVGGAPSTDNKEKE